MNHPDQKRIDINADAGESYGRWTIGNDDALLPFTTSVNIACGFHAGDPLTIRRTLDLAVRHNLAVGAHVSYPDLAGFGRRDMTMSSDELTAAVLYQIASLDGLARVAGTLVQYVKPHGALYHRTLKDTDSAEAVVSAIKNWPTELMLLTTCPSVVATVAEKNDIVVASEGFAERRYGTDGLLVARSQPDALIVDPLEAATQALHLADSQAVRSICIHGDSPNAAQIASRVRAELEQRGYLIAPFV